MTFQERLTYSREQAGLSLSQVAKMTEISRSTLYRWEAGDTEPSIADLRKLAELYRCSECWLLTGETNTNVTQGFTRILAGKTGQVRVDLEGVIYLLSTLVYDEGESE